MRGVIAHSAVARITRKVCAVGQKVEDWQDNRGENRRRRRMLQYRHLDGVFSVALDGEWRAVDVRASLDTFYTNPCETPSRHLFSYSCTIFMSRCLIYMYTVTVGR